MDAWMAFVSIIAIVAIVVIAGGIIAFIGHMIIGVFDKDRQATNTKTEALDYSQYKQLENTGTNEYDFSAINIAKAQKEKEEAQKGKDEELFKLLENNDSDDDIKEIEERLKKQEQPEPAPAPAPVPAPAKVEEEDNEDLDSLLDEISGDVADEEKDRINEENNNNKNSILSKYNIDDILNDIESNEEPEEEQEEVVEEPEEVIEEPAPEPEPVEDNSEELEKANKEIEDLKAQLAEMNQKLEDARTVKEEVSVNMTEEECLARLATLEERLKAAKKDYKINMKEFRPLQRVMKQYEKYIRKLRKKDAQLANKKISLYGVNNYVDLDKEKAENVLNESELVEGLRLSVSHCEEVINANKDRYPILEHTNNILENQIANLEADIENTKQILARIREKKGSGSNEDQSK